MKNESKERDVSIITQKDSEPIVVYGTKEESTNLKKSHCGNLREVIMLASVICSNE